MWRSLTFGAAVMLAVAGASAVAGPAIALRPAPAVLLVCNGSTAQCPGASGTCYSTVQGAVDAARPGDWILIYPGVYHEKSARWPTAGVWVDKPDLHIRGLDRNRVIIDGSDGTAAPTRRWEPR